MIKIFKKISVTLLFVAAGSVLFSSCFDKFDSDSYKPAFTIGGFASVDEIQPDNLVAYWPFDGTLHESESGTAATNKGASFVNGFKGQALSVTATDKSYAYTEPGSSVTSMGSFSISFWINPTFVDADANNGVDGILGLLSLSNQDRFWGNIEWFVENNSNPDGAILKVILTNDNSQETDILVSGYKGFFGAWTSHTLTFDEATSKLTYYINGAKAQSKVVPWAGPITLSNNGPLVFGAVQFQTTPSMTSSHGSEGWAGYLTGTLDEVRIYDKALTDAEVNAVVVLQGKGK